MPLTLVSRTGLVLTSIMLLGVSLSRAQQAPHAPPAPGNASDRQFVMDAAMIGMAEVEFGKLASKRAEAPAVQAFARQLAIDHAGANDELKLIAAMSNVPWPVVLDGKHQATLDALSLLSGAAFDRAFMKEMVDGHQNAAAVFRGEIENGSDPAVRKWAEKTLPTIEEHLKMAQEIAKATRN